MGNPKGILSPWAKEEKAQEAPPPARPWRSSSEDRTHPEHLDMETLRLPGRTRAIYVKSLRGKDGLEVLGIALLGIAVKIPAMKSLYARQMIGFDPPVSPHVILKFGEVTIYAGAVTTDVVVASAMAVDRIAHALTQAKAQIPEAKKYLADNHIEITNL